MNKIAGKIIGNTTATTMAVPETLIINFDEELKGDISYMKLSIVFAQGRDIVGKTVIDGDESFIYFDTITRNSNEIILTVSDLSLTRKWTCKRNGGWEYEELPLRGGNDAPFVITFDENLKGNRSYNDIVEAIDANKQIVGIAHLEGITKFNIVAIQAAYNDDAIMLSARGFDGDFVIVECTAKNEWSVTAKGYVSSGDFEGYKNYIELNFAKKEEVEDLTNVAYRFDETIEISQSDSSYVLIRQPSTERHEVEVSVYTGNEFLNQDSCWLTLAFGVGISEYIIQPKEFIDFTGSYIFTFTPHDYPEFIDNLSDVVSNTIKADINFADTVKATIETCDVEVRYKKKVTDVIGEISDALSQIIEIQNSLIGGDA